MYNERCTSKTQPTHLNATLSATPITETYLLLDGRAPHAPHFVGSCRGQNTIAAHGHEGEAVGIRRAGGRAAAVDSNRHGVAGAGEGLNARVVKQDLSRSGDQGFEYLMQTAAA